MAKQRGIFKVEGTLDDVTFFKRKDGYLLRKNNPISAERMATDPAFQRPRENGAEFGRAGKAGRVFPSWIVAKSIAQPDGEPPYQGNVLSAAGRLSLQHQLY